MRVQISLEGDDYAALKKLAEEEDRTVAGQARHMLRGELARLRGAQEPLNGLGNVDNPLSGDDFGARSHHEPTIPLCRV